jgi:hypothetical protein
MRVAKSSIARTRSIGHCVDMKLFNQEILRAILLDTRQRLITMIDVTKGGLNESLAQPRDIFRPVICHSANSFILVIIIRLETKPKRSRSPPDPEAQRGCPDSPNPDAGSRNRRASDY